MDKFRVRSVDQGQTKIRSVPIAVTPEGFWCCPAPVVFQKTLKTQINAHQKQRPPPPPPPQKNSTPKSQSHPTENKPSTVPSRPTTVPDGTQSDTKSNNCSSVQQAEPGVSQRPSKPSAENIPRKVSVEFGEAGSSDLKIIISGKQGVVVRVSVNKKVLVEQSKFFADKMPDHSLVSCVEIGDCEDIEIYVETIGLMYSKDMKQRLIKQSVPRVLRILKVAESIGFSSCIQSCLEYLEAAPWVGDEEDKVVSSIVKLQIDNKGKGTVLKRVSSEIPNPPNDTLRHILDLVLKSNDERARRDMKALVLKLLRENCGSSNGISDSYNDNIYSSCKCSLVSLLNLFEQASKPGFNENFMDNKGSIAKQIALEADNLLWLLEILISRQVADEFAVLWFQQTELAALHSKLSIVSRYLVSCITARLFVGIGRGEMLPCKKTRHLLLQTWLQPLISDYNWLQHGCRSFDRKIVEEGIGRTILTLPLEDQQSILLSWMGSFLKAGDNCPNLHRAFEVWWRRTFVRPYVEQQNFLAQLPDDGTTPD